VHSTILREVQDSCSTAVACTTKRKEHAKQISTLPATLPSNRQLSNTISQVVSVLKHPDPYLLVLLENRHCRGG
jgi:hypothetical protein